MLGKASKIGSGLFSKLKSGINDLTETTLNYAEQRGWDQQLRSNVGLNLPRSGPKHSQAFDCSIKELILQWRFRAFYFDFHYWVVLFLI